MKHNKPIDPQRMLFLESRARTLAEIVRAGLQISEPGEQKKYGFMLLLFSFDGSEATYTSNADRTDMIEFLEEMLLTLKTNQVFEPGVLGNKN